MMLAMFFVENLWKDQRYFLAVVITVVVSICLHELAHGFAAIWLGDRTPIEAGHMTPNPAVHMGVFSVVALLVAGIAWGAMPVTPSRLRGRYGDALVAVAGPVCNVVLAVLGLGALGLWQRFEGFNDPGEQAMNLRYFLFVFGVVNMHLAIFNLIPVPPLDGSRILANLSDGYRTLSDRLTASGGITVVFILVFIFSGRVTQPAALRASTWILELARG